MWLQHGLGACFFKGCPSTFKSGEVKPFGSGRIQYQLFGCQQLFNRTVQIWDHVGRDRHGAMAVSMDQIAGGDG